MINALININKTIITGDGNQVIQTIDGKLTVEEILNRYTSELDGKIKLLEQRIIDKDRIEGFLEKEVLELKNQLENLQNERNELQQDVASLLLLYGNKNLSKSSDILKQAIDLLFIGNFNEANILLDEEKLNKELEDLRKLDTQAEIRKMQLSEQFALKSEIQLLSKKYELAIKYGNTSIIINPKNYHALIIIGVSFQQLKEFKNSLTYFNKAYEEIANLENNSSELGYILGLLAGNYIDLNEFSLAEKNINTLIKIGQQRVKNKHILIQGYHLMAILSERRKDYSELLEYGLCALLLNIELKYKKQNMPILINNVATAYFFLNNHLEALKYLNKSLEFYKELYGTNDLLIGGSVYYNMGYCYLKLDKDSSIGFDLIKKAIKIESEILGPNHIKLFHYYATYALRKEITFNYKDAEFNYKKAIKIGTLKWGDCNEEVSDMEACLARMYQNINRNKEAIHYFTKSIISREQIFGKNDLTLMKFLAARGLSYLRSKNYTLANIDMKKVIHIVDINSKNGTLEHIDKNYQIFAEQITDILSRSEKEINDINALMLDIPGR